MSKSDTDAMIVLMGATGTGKSTFINLLTNDDSIHVGHDLESTTFNVNTSFYTDQEAGVRVLLVDTPGFDDSRDGVSDTDILAKIVEFLGGRQPNGLIYLHRISDPRMGGTSKKNLKIFRELCGDDNLGNTCIVTTYWNIVGEEEGKDREAALAGGAFKPFTDAGAKLMRHDKGLDSARLILSDLVRKRPVTLKIQEELNTGKDLGDTSAGAIIVEEAKEMQRKHEKEMEGLKKEMEEAMNERNEGLRAELDEVRKKLAERMERVEKDRKRLAMGMLVSDTRTRLEDKTMHRRKETDSISTGVHVNPKVFHGDQLRPKEDGKAKELQRYEKLRQDQERARRSWSVAQGSDYHEGDLEDNSEGAMLKGGAKSAEVRPMLDAAKNSDYENQEREQRWNHQMAMQQLEHDKKVFQMRLQLEEARREASKPSKLSSTLDKVADRVSYYVGKVVDLGTINQPSDGEDEENVRGARPKRNGARRSHSSYSGTS